MTFTFHTGVTYRRCSALTSFFSLVYHVSRAYPYYRPEFPGSVGFFDDVQAEASARGRGGERSLNRGVVLKDLARPSLLCFETRLALMKRT